MSNFNTPTVKANIEIIHHKNTTISTHSKENLSHCIQLTI